MKYLFVLAALLFTNCSQILVPEEMPNVNINNTRDGLVSVSQYDIIIDTGLTKGYNNIQLIDTLAPIKMIIWETKDTVIIDYTEEIVQL